MRPDEFSRPERFEGGYVSYCLYGGAVVDPSRKGVERQIEAADRDEWLTWIKGKK